MPQTHLVALDQPSCWEADRYRALRHVLSGLLEDNRRNGQERAQLDSAAAQRGWIIAISSAAPQEGKTTTAINLAATLAESPGTRVLLADVDMRVGGLADYLKIVPSGFPSVAEAICDSSMRLEDIVHLDARHRFSIAIAGSRHRVAPHLAIESPRLGALLQQARNSFDVVVLDTCPLVPVADCYALAKWVDGFVVVVAAHKTRRELLVEALSTIEPNKLLGLVFNGDDRTTRRYRAFRHYHHAPDAGW